MSNTFKKIIPTDKHENTSDLPDGFDEKMSNPASENHDFSALIESTPEQPHEDINDQSKYVAPISVLIKNNRPEPEKTVEYASAEKGGDRYLKYAIAVCLLVFGYFALNRVLMPKFKKTLKVRDLAAVSENTNTKTAATTAAANQAENKAVNKKTTYQQLVENKKGYINLNLTEENIDVKIKINGFQLIDTLPLVMYPIIAEREIDVVAINTKTNKAVFKKIQVKHGETLDLIINMNEAVDSTK
ncbi:hypothetical protein K2P97_00145 [bacterium]|nr:hypothetical protein [bacterium]